ncbi:MAG: mechanosensitive ion channel family protein [Calditrichaeota bacterium]|nr:MAG: mechanosensitive ion channel family protein [Calditrichota bacterium]
MEQLQSLSTQGLNLIILYAPKLLLSIITLIIGLWAIRMFMRVFERGLQKSRVEPSLQRFFASMLSILLKVLLLLSVARMVGIETTSFIALLGAAGLAVGLALQGSLANFAGGVLILLFKPFKVGDFIEAQGHAGTVKEIQVFNTLMLTPDNKTVILPNGQLSSGSIINYSAQDTRRVDMIFGIGYDDDLQKAKAVLEKLVQEDERIHADPEPLVRVAELADNSVNFAVRVWCNTSDYWNVFFDLQEKVKTTFDAEGISIPYPQRDVHIFQSAKIS